VARLIYQHLNNLYKKKLYMTKKNTESKLHGIIVESTVKVLKEHAHNIENWWKHNGSFDREQASGIPYNGDVANHLRLTDEWWESLSDEDKIRIYDDYFAEY
jgi:hypothetical protein